MLFFFLAEPHGDQKDHRQHGDCHDSRRASQKRGRIAELRDAQNDLSVIGFLCDRGVFAVVRIALCDDAFFFDADRAVRDQHPIPGAERNDIARADLGKGRVSIDNADASDGDRRGHGAGRHHIEAEAAADEQQQRGGSSKKQIFQDCASGMKHLFQRNHPFRQHRIIQRSDMRIPLSLYHNPHGISSAFLRKIEEIARKRGGLCSAHASRYAL